MRKLALAALGLALFAGLESSASGAERAFDYSKPEYVELRLPATGGYRFEFSASPDDRIAQVSFSDEDGEASYFSVGPTRFSDKRIVAGFEQLGRVSIEYRLRGKRPKGRFCVVPKSRPMDFRGTIRIRGENGYAEVDARAAGGRADVYPKHCDSGPRKTATPRIPRKLVDLNACTISDGRELSYSAFEGYPFLQGQSGHYARLIEKLGRVQVYRTAGFLGGTTTLDEDRRTDTATVTPAGRFSGSATYRDGRLTGDLTALFPGITEPVPIAPTPADLAFGDFAGGECPY